MLKANIRRIGTAVCATFTDGVFVMVKEKEEIEMLLRDASINLEDLPVEGSLPEWWYDAALLEGTNPSSHGGPETSLTT